MVDTRRLEKLIGPSRTPAAEPGAEAPAPAHPARRALALSGARELRQTGQRPRRSPQRDAAVAAQWDALETFHPAEIADAARARLNLMARDTTITTRFDVLRTQLLQAFRSRGLVSLGVSAPKSGVGTSLVASGLFASLARRSDVRVIALDLNLAAPALHQYFEIAPIQSNADLLSGLLGPADCLQRLGDTAAVAPALPADAISGADCTTEDMERLLARLHREYAPDIILCDLPPLLQGDTAMNLGMAIDAMLLGADTGTTSAADISACERVLAGQTEFLGVVMNQYRGWVTP